MYHLCSTNSSTLLAWTPLLSMMQLFLQSCPEFIVGSAWPRSRYFCGCLEVKMKTAIIPMRNFGPDSKQTQKQAHKQDSRGAQQCLVFTQGWKCGLCCSVICWEHCIQSFVYSFSEASKRWRKNSTDNTYALGNEAKVHLLNEHMLLIHQAQHNDKYKSPKSTDVWKECVIMLLHQMYHLHLFFRNEFGGGLRRLHCT